jgi:hypothetical protein
MKSIQFASLRVQIMLATVLLVALLVFSGTWILVSTERELYYLQLEKQAKALSMSLAGSFRLEMAEDNWGNIRIRTDELLRNNSLLLHLPNLRRNIFPILCHFMSRS